MRFLMNIFLSYLEEYITIKQPTEETEKKIDRKFLIFSNYIRLRLFKYQELL